MTATTPRIVVPDLLGIFNRTDQEDPLKVWRYHVEIENFSRFGFSSCTGLKPKTETVKYREGGNNATFQKSPGLTEWDNITLRRGVILAAGYGDKDTLNWYKQVYDASSKSSAGSFRRNIDIVLFDKEGTEVRRWRVVECWPTEPELLPDLDAMDSGNMIESMVLAHEGAYLVGE